MNVILKERSEATKKTHINIHIVVDLNVSALMAKRKITTYLVDNVSDHLGGEAPALVIDDEQFLWRVPVVLYLASKGKVGKVGDIDVDAQSGTLMVTANLIEELKASAEYLATRFTL